MRIVLGAIAISVAVVATEASAQGVNLTGPYRCGLRRAGCCFRDPERLGAQLGKRSGTAIPRMGGLSGPALDRQSQSRRDLFPGWGDHPIRQRNDLAASAGGAASSAPPSPPITSR